MRATARAISVLWTVLLVLVVCAAVVLLVTDSGIRVVQTGSMAPNIPAGSAVLVSPASTSDVGTGDVIVFAVPSASAEVMHRVVEVEAQGGVRFFRTQGDANDQPDGRLVPQDDVVAVVRGSAAGLGSLVHALRPPWGLLWLVVLPWSLTIVLGWFARRRQAPSHAGVNDDSHTLRPAAVGDPNAEELEWAGN